MKQYVIENHVSGAVLGIYDGDTEGEALENLRADAGYTDDDPSEGYIQDELTAIEIQDVAAWGRSAERSQEERDAADYYLSQVKQG